MRRRFLQCDVFSPLATRGNGLAVVLDGEGLSDEAMQRFAAWTQLAETTFLLPPQNPDADYRLRIFTTTRELPFAGHPTLGSCMSWLHAGGVPKTTGLVRQECGVGLVEVDVSAERPAFVAPPTRIEPLEDAVLASALRALRIDPADVVASARLVNGPVWEFIELRDAEAVLRADAAGASFPEERAIGLLGAYPPGGEADFEVRMIDIWHGVKEDPITGSLNAAIARWLKAEGRLDGPYVAAQGRAIGRHGRVHVRPRGEDVLVGGDVSVLIEGVLEF